MKERNKTAFIFAAAGFGWLTFALLFDFGKAGATWCWGIAWGVWFFQRPESQRIEALIERMATTSWCDTSHHAEAREIWALLKGEKDAR